MIPQDLLLVKILKIVLQLLPEIELPQRVGRPFVYSVKVIICCLLVMVAKKLSVRGLYAFLTSKEDCQAESVRNTIPFPDGNIPNRRTFNRRFKKSMLSLQLYMLSAVFLLVRRLGLGIARLSLDNRMFEAFGAIWHRKDQKKGIIPEKVRNIDTTAGWGVSAYRGWIFGHALDVFVTTGKLVIPVLALARSLIIRGNTAVKAITNLLPQVKKGVVSADSEYFDQDLDNLLQENGRRLHAPSKRDPETTPKSVTYDRRKKTVEPFYERFLLAFTARGKLDRKGPDAWPYLVACCFLYQLMVIYNVLANKPNPLEVTHLICLL